MSWYYIREREQVGPLSDNDLSAAIQAGELSDSTLVWREGLEDWVPLGQVRSGEQLPASPAEQEFPAPPEGPMAWCSECGQPRPESETLQYGNSRVCAECKPRFLQRLREGGRFGEGLQYAGVGIRALALIIDVVLLSIVIGLVLAVATMALEGNAQAIAGNLWVSVGLIVGLSAFEIFMLFRYGGTPGKLVLRLRVVDENGGPLSLRQATIRSIWSTVLTGIPMFGWPFYVAESLSAAFDAERRALHDRVCQTRVVRKEA